MEHLKEWEVIKQHLINGKSHKTIVKFFDFALHLAISAAIANDNSFTVNLSSECF